MKELLSFLDGVPKYYKEGRWAYEAHFGVLLIGIWIAFYYRDAVTSYNEGHELSTASHAWSFEGIEYVYFGIGLYFGLFTLGAIYLIGPWPLVSYTITSWNVLTARLLAVSLSHWHPPLRSVARVLKFPAVLMSTVTCSVWWCVLVPVIYSLLPGQKARGDFMKFNFSPFLLHIHGVNLPVAMMDFVAHGIKLTFFDLYCGVVISYIYMLFYLNVLDPAGVQIYIVFTPRTRWSIAIYGSIFVIHLLLWQSGNRLIDAVHG